MLDWKKIEENWKKFTEVNHLDIGNNETKYLYGYQDIYQAKENFEGFEIFYENRFNKSSKYGSSIKLGHRMTVLAAIILNQPMELRIKRNSLWNRFIRNKGNLNVVSQGINTKNLIPLTNIEQLIRHFSDMTFSIKSYEKYRDENIPFGQSVISIESKHQPTELEQLQLYRIIITQSLKELKDQKLIGPCINC